MAINHPDCFPTIQPAWQQKDEEALKDEQIKKLKQKVGELVLESDVLKEAVGDKQCELCILSPDGQLERPKAIETTSAPLRSSHI